MKFKECLRTWHVSDKRKQKQSVLWQSNPSDRLQETCQPILQNPAKYKYRAIGDKVIQVTVCKKCVYSVNKILRIF